MEKLWILVNINYLLFLGDIHDGYLSLEKPDDNNQFNFAIQLNNFDKCNKHLKKFF